jgi:hypothetical protein
MKKRYMVLVGLAAMFLIVAGCGSLGTQLTRLEMDYGTSYNLAKFNQIVNPEAEKNLKPVTGLDGVAAQKVVQRYQKDFEKAAPEAASPMSSILNINVGGGGQ